MLDFAHRQEFGRAIISYFLGRMNALRGGNIAFVQIGANDGVTDDFLFPWQHVGGWSGAVIEPVPYLFERLKANYAPYPKVKALNLLIGESDGTAPFYYFEEKSGIGEFIGSLNKEVVMRHAVFFDDINARMKIANLEMVSMKKLHKVTGFSRINLIVSDTEGFDIKLLEAYDFSKRPDLYIIESKHNGTHDLLSCDEKMAGMGYRVVKAFEDTIYICPEIIEAGKNDLFFQRVLAGSAALFG